MRIVSSFAEGVLDAHAYCPLWFLVIVFLPPDLVQTFKCYVKQYLNTKCVTQFRTLPFQPGQADNKVKLLYLGAFFSIDI